MDYSLFQTIDIRSIVRDIIRQWWVIILAVLAAYMLTYVYVSVCYVPNYSTGATLAVTGRESNRQVYRNTKDAQKTAERFAQMLDSALLRKAVRDDLDMNEFNAKTGAKLVEGTNMIELTVSGSSAMDCYRISRSILENYDKVSDYIVGSVSVDVIEYPSMPVRPTNRKDVEGPARRTAGYTAVLMALLIGALSVRRSTVKNVEQFRSHVDSHKLGVIYHEQKTNHQYVTLIGRAFIWLLDLLPLPAFLRGGRRNVSMLVSNPKRSFFYAESNRLAASRVRSRMDRIGAKVVMVTSVMENEGKSTVTANIACSLAAAGKKVLLIDCDFRKPSQYKIFDLEKNMWVNLVRYLNDPTISREPARQYQDTDLYLIANIKSAKESGADVDMKRLGAIIDYYRERMDYIILDSSPVALVSDTEALAKLAECSVIVVREDVAATEHINDTIDSMNHAGARVLGCIFNDAHRMLFGSGSERHGSYGGYYYGKRRSE